MAIIEPISTAQRQQVIDETNRFIDLAGEIYGRRFASVPVLFDLKGQAAGMYKIKGRQRVIRYNPWLFAKYWHENFTATVPHEVAHYIVEQMYYRAQPHGAQWRAVMAAFNADDSRTVDFDMTGIPQRVVRTVDYFCGCRVHRLSMQRHNRVRYKRASYLCCYCKGSLKEQIRPECGAINT